MSKVRDVLTATQSPCRQTPGYVSKYDARYRSMSSSFQNRTGIDGIGARTTSSPTVPKTSSPASSNAVTSAPSVGPEIAPRYTGSHGLPATKLEQMSVP